MTATTSYMPGEWVAVSAPGTWLLVALPPDHPIVQRCWELMSTDGTTEDLLDALVSEGIRFAPHFALACAVGQHRVFARGSAAVTVTDSAGAVELKVSAAPGMVWAEEGFTDEVDMLLLANGSAPQSDLELPMASGVTMASSIRIRSRDGELAPRPAVSPISITLPLTADTTRAAMADAAGQLPVEDHDHQQPDRSPATAGTAGSDEQAAPEPKRSYDYLFGATQRPPEVEDDAAAPPDQLPPQADPAMTAGWSTMVPPELADDEAAAASPIGGANAGTDGRVIDAVPWLAARPVEGLGKGTPTGSMQWQGGPPADVGLTVDRSALHRELEPPPIGATVLAGYCSAGHLSPPYAATCRVCRAPMPPDQPGFEMVRPALGVIRLADGGTVTLDRGVLFGRAPETSAEADDRPHLVRLVSPENDVSRNHAQIVIDGWHVYVQDLGSTNGTVVTLPGRGPVRLRPDDLQLLESGSTITLADEITVTFEVTG
jgi:hypothetical protein